MNDVLDLVISSLPFSETQVYEDYITVRKRYGYEIKSEACKCCSKLDCKKGAKTVDEFKDATDKLNEIVELCDMKLTASNGTFYIYKDRNPLVATEEEVKKFKEENEYAINMKGIKHKTQTVYDANIKGSGCNGSVRRSLMKRFLTKELAKANIIEFLRYFKKNSYRQLKSKTIDKKTLELNIDEKVIDCLIELKYLAYESKIERKDRYWQITKEGMKLI